MPLKILRAMEEDRSLIVLTFIWAAILAIEAEAKRLTGALLEEVECQKQERRA